MNRAPERPRRRIRAETLLHPYTLLVTSVAVAAPEGKIPKAQGD